MKLAWYTPYSVNSAIGRFSRLVIGSLRKLGADVQVVRSETKTGVLREKSACDQEKWVWAADLPRNVANWLGQFDLVVYNVGDHYDYHTYCFQHQSIVPGLTILHDYCLHHALHHHCQRTTLSSAQYRDQLQAECGAEAVQVYDRLSKTSSPQLWWHHELARFPVYRWAIQDTLGVITHAEFYRGTVAQRVGCPTACVPLAYDTPLDAKRETHRQQSGKLTILTVGAVNANKRYEAVIRALAESPLLRERCRYRIVGSANTAQRQMIRIAAEAHLHQPDVSLTGQVTREVLREEMAAADIISCLRYPALEGASASVVEGLLSGKPVVVCDTGCYREIPNDVVFKVSPGREHTQLTHVLEQIVMDYPAALARGQAAQTWAGSRHESEFYARQLMDFAERVLYNRPVLQVVDRLAQQLRHWQSHPDASLLNRIDRTLIELFGRPDNMRRAA
jgi:glycosyltransferase involved in cell wall biosynthesis